MLESVARELERASAGAAKTDEEDETARVAKITDELEEILMVG